MSKKTAPWPADEVGRRPVAGLIPYARNARTHSDEQVAQIAASIREWGWTTPVLVDADGTIIAGHGRVLAAKKLGLAEIPVMVATGWTKAQKQAYVLADNKLALNAGWDLDLLQTELADLRDDHFDMDVIGFTKAELGDLLDKPFEFAPASEEEQGRLDEKKTQETNCVCPNCGHEFIKQI